MSGWILLSGREDIDSLRTLDAELNTETRNPDEFFTERVRAP